MIKKNNSARSRTSSQPPAPPPPPRPIPPGFGIDQWGMVHKATSPR